MNENNRDILKNILGKCEVKTETASFAGYLVPDTVLDLDADEVNNNTLAKFVIWVKAVPLAIEDNEKQNQLLNIEKEIIAFTSSHSNGANSSIYVMEDDLKVFADYLKNKYPKFVVITNIDSLLQKRVQVVSQEPPVIQQNVSMERPKEDLQNGLVLSNQTLENPKPLTEVVPEVQPNVMDNIPVTNVSVSSIEPTVIADSGQQQINPNVISTSPVQENAQSMNMSEPNVTTPQNLGTNPIPVTPENSTSQNNFSFNGTTVDHSMEQVPIEQKNNVLTLEKKDSKVGNLARAGFVKFPVFLLTIMAVGAIGIFIGKMFYMYLSQQ